MRTNSSKSKKDFWTIVFAFPVFCRIILYPIMNKKYLDYILDHKPLYGGIGIIMVICYHLLCIDESVPVYWLFYPGFIGVDLFMFFGGYSLCFSLEKHGLSEFYKRRLKRIAEMALFCLSYNMRRAINLKGVPALVAALR